MPTTYGSLRSQQTGVTFAAIAGGNLTDSGSIWLSAQGRNRAGLNLHSTPVQISYSAGQQIRATVATTARTAGEANSLHHMVISGSPDNNPANMRQLAVVNLLGTNQTTQTPLPLDFNLTHPAHLVREGIVEGAAALPQGSDLVAGMLRTVTALGKTLRYDPLATAGLVASSPGFWVEHWNWTGASSPFTTYFGVSTEGAGGCDRSLLALPDTDLIYPPIYPRDGSTSTPVRYTLQNGLTEDAGATISAGEPLGVMLTVDGTNLAELFSGKILSRYLGLFRKTDSTLNTTRQQVAAVPLLIESTGNGNATSSQSVIENIPRGYGALYEISLKYRVDELPALLSATNLGFYFYPQGNIGRFDPTGQLIGNAIYPSQSPATDGRCRIVPAGVGANRLPGAGTIKSYEFDVETSQPVTGFLPVAANQLVTIAGVNRGLALIRQSLVELGALEIVRAIISTVAGTQTPSAWSTPAVVSGGAGRLTVTVTFPTAVRSNYPDLVAGVTAGFNAPNLAVFLRLSGTIYRTIVATVPNVASQVIEITALGTEVGSLPSSAANFGLFSLAVPGVTVAGGGSLAAGSYEVAISADYPATTNVEISSITHTDPICVREVNQPLIEILSAGGGGNRTIANFVQPAVSSSVSVSVTNADLLPLNGTIFIQDAGYYLLQSRQSFQAVTLQNLGLDAAIVGATIPAGAIVSVAGARGVQGIAGTAGANAFTTQVGSLLQSNPGFSQVFNVVSSAPFAVGQTVFVVGGGYYTITSIPNATSLNLFNLGYTENAAPGAIVGSGLITAAGIRGAVGDIALISPRTVTVSGDFQSTDPNRLIIVNSTNPVTLTIQANTVIAIPVNSRINILRKGMGTVAVNPGSGVTLNSPDSQRNLRLPYSWGVIYKEANDVWYLTGDLAT